MLTLLEYIEQVMEEELLTERVLSIGLKPEHEKFREKHRQEIHDMLRKAYDQPDLGGYGGIKTGSKEESDAIHHDITHSAIKAHRRNGKITAVSLYKKQHGRKMIAVATDGTDQGKKDFLKTSLEDHEQKRAWGEASGKVEHLMKKQGYPAVPSSRAKELLNKDVVPHDDGHHYDRKLGDGNMHTKMILGHPKKS